MVLGVFDLYHKRKQRERGEYPDVYKYDKLPNKLRVQIIHIIKDVVPEDPTLIHSTTDLYGKNKDSRVFYEYIHEILLKEEGVFELPLREGTDDSSYFVRVANFFLQIKEVEKALSIIEIIFRFISYLFENDPKCIDAEKELNARFKEHGIGYQFENRQIIRVDSQLVHSEVVKPALQLLSNKMYKGAQDEFLKAHQHYRDGNYTETLNECLKAYESTMKAIIKKHNWDCKPNATANELAGRCLQNGLIPEYWTQYFSSLKNTLTAGVPTARNNLSGHGKGDDIKDIPDYLAAYILHQTAALIVFLANAEKALNTP